MSIQILEKIFGSSARVKIMRLFLFNPEEHFEKKDIIKRAKINSTTATKEINNLLQIGLIKKQTAYKEIKSKNDFKKKKIQGLILNKNFVYLNKLKSLLLETESVKDNDLIKEFNNSGKIKLIVISGVFVQSSEEDSRLDLLLVGDDLKERKLKNTISKIESEVGKELRYAIFSTPDFKYRMGIYDRLIRDTFDFPHKIVIDRIGI